MTKWVWEDMEHTICHNLIRFLPLSEGQYILWTPEDGTPLDLETLVDKRNRGGCEYIVIACNNKYALRMFAGVPGQSGELFQGLQRQDSGSKESYSKEELKALLARNGMDQYEFYYPYPSIEIPMAVYSDSYLPKVGELTYNLNNFGTDRALLFDETVAWNHIIRDGLFGTFANSFLLVIGPKLKWPNGDVIFTKFSNDRSPLYNIRTDIVSRDNGFVVIKNAMDLQAIDHIKKLQDRYEELKKAYPELEFNYCQLCQDVVEFEYLEGLTLDEILLGLLQQNREDDFLSMVREYVRRVSHSTNPSLIDVDMIFKNIIISDSGDWTVLDYEWTFDKAYNPSFFAQKLTTQFVIYRSIFYFIRDNDLDDEHAKMLYQLMDVCEDEIKQYEQLEAEFQKFVEGEHESLGALYGRYHGEVYDVIKQMNERKRQNEMEVYIRNSKGKMCTAYNWNRIMADDLCEITLPVDEQVEQVEINLGHCNRIVDITEVAIDGNSILKDVKTNGYRYYENLYLFGGESAEPKLTVFTSGRKGQLYVRVVMSNQGDNTSAAFATLYHYVLKKDAENCFLGKCKKLIKRGKDEH